VSIPCVHTVLYTSLSQLDADIGDTVFRHVIVHIEEVTVNELHQCRLDRIIYALVHVWPHALNLVVVDALNL